MLIRLTDHKGRDRYVNAGFVKSVHPKSENSCDVEVSGWHVKIRVPRPASEVALEVNAAMPGIDSILRGEMSEEEQRQRQAAAAAAAG